MDVPMVARTAIETAQFYLRVVRENGIPVSFGVLFGSQARGTAHEYSDIDLVVVSSHFDGKKDFDEVNKLWQLTAKTDNRVEPVPVGEREWKEDESRAIIEIARREGQIVEV
ncbi:MAG: nucleotidyltransferase domain-containing protein [Chitinivibrionales bacterium]|nr:nucleotidyltransferase domain-containing protein [Chitinivibrionales bacterium]